MRERLASCEAHLRRHLAPDEHVLAIGRAEDITERGGLGRGGAAWTFVMVTDRRLRWVPGVDTRSEASLDIDDVTAVAEEMKAHRYAVTLDHRPLTRLMHVPAHRFLRFEWGNAFAEVTLARTRLAFSRRDTAVAVELRKQLVERQVLVDPSRDPPRSG